MYQTPQIFSYKTSACTSTTVIILDSQSDMYVASKIKLIVIHLFLPMDSDERDYDQLIGKNLTVHQYGCDRNYKNINSNGT